MLRSTTRCRRTETTTPFRTGPAAPDFSGGRSRNEASPLAYPICAETRSSVPFPLLPVMICLPWATPASVTRRTVKSLPILVSSTQCWDPFANAAALAMASNCAGVLPVRPLLVELHAGSPTALTSTAAGLLKYRRSDVRVPINAAQAEATFGFMTRRRRVDPRLWLLTALSLRARYCANVIRR